MRQQHSQSSTGTKFHSIKRLIHETKRPLAASLSAEETAESFCIVGPAGAGKSTLMRQILAEFEQQGKVCSWLNFDERDNSPVTFLSSLYAALDNLKAGISNAFPTPADLTKEGGVEQALLSIQPKLAKLPQNRVLFLDDLHHISEPQLLKGLEQFLDACVGSLRIVIGSRAVPKTQMERREIDGQFRVIEQSDLSFSAQEAVDFFNSFNDIDLNADEIQEIREAMDGWAAGLQFAAIFLRKKPNQKSLLLSHMARGDAELSHYLTSNAFDIQSAEVQHFLLETSPLYTFNPDLCQHVLGDSSAMALIEKVRALNLFLIRLDVPGEWFRYHHLFGDFLRAKLNVLTPEKSKSIKLKAAAWYIENDMAEEAIRYLLECEEFEQAAGLISEIGISKTRDEGSLATILRWVEALPEAYRNHSPQLIADYSLALAFTRTPHRARKLIASMHEGLEAQPPRWEISQAQRAELLCYAEAVNVVSYSVEENTEATITNADLWLNRWLAAPDANFAIVQLSRSYALLIQNSFERASVDNASGQTHALRSDSSHVSIWAECIETMILTAQGKFNAAEICASRSIKRAESELDGHAQVHSMTYLLKAFVDYEQGFRDSAYQALQIGLDFVDKYGPVEPLLIAFRLKAQMLREQEKWNDALEALEQGFKIGLSHKLHRMSVTLLADQITFLLELGRIEEAETLSQKWNVSGVLDHEIWDAQSQTLSSLGKRIDIELSIAKGDPKRAIKISQPLIHDLRRNGRFRSYIRVLVLRAVALWFDGQTKKSWREMSSALAEAKERNFAASFFELRKLCVPIIEEIVAFRHQELGKEHRNIEAPEDWILEVLKGDAPDKQPRGNSVPASTDFEFYEALTNREKTMLRLAVKGHSNAEIASTLLISVATVKWHLHNAFQKLNVKNRSAAVAKAAELGII